MQQTQPPTTRKEFMEQFDPSIKEHRLKAKHIVLNPVSTRKKWFSDAGHTPTDDKLLFPSGYQEQIGYLCPSAYFDKNGWHWRFTVEYFAN